MLILRNKLFNNNSNNIRFLWSTLPVKTTKQQCKKQLITANSDLYQYHKRYVGTDAGNVGEEYINTNDMYMNAVVFNNNNININNSNNINDATHKPLSIQQMPIPYVSANQLLVKVLYTSINPLDSMAAQGYNRVVNHVIHNSNSNNIYNTTLQQQSGIVLGRECVGKVVLVGDNMLKYNVGDLVWCSIDPLHTGCFSEYVCVNHNEVSHTPYTLAYRSLASLPFSITTAWNALVTIAGLGPVHNESTAPKLHTSYGPSYLTYAESILTSIVQQQLPILPSLLSQYYTNDTSKRIFIHGGSGSIGTFAVQLLKKWGHYVIITAHPAHHQRMLSYGADVIIDYTKHNWINISELVGNIDVFLDYVGGNDVEAKAESIKVKHFITTRGDLVNYIDTYGLAKGTAKGLYTLERKKLHWLTLYGCRYDWCINKPSHALQYATELANQTTYNQHDIGQNEDELRAGLHTFVDKTIDLYGLQGIIDGIELMQQGKAKNGKIVVQVAEDDE